MFTVFITDSQIVQENMAINRKSLIIGHFNDFLP